MERNEGFTIPAVRGPSVWTTPIILHTSTRKLEGPISLSSAPFASSTLAHFSRLVQRITSFSFAADLEKGKRVDPVTVKTFGQPYTYEQVLNPVVPKKLNSHDPSIAS